MAKHLKKPDVKMSLCGQTGHMVEYTENINEVTCTRCIKSATTVTYDMKQRERRMKRMVNNLKKTRAVVLIFILSGFFIACSEVDKSCYGVFECVGGILVCQGTRSTASWMSNYPGYVTKIKCSDKNEGINERGDNVPQYTPTK